MSATYKIQFGSERLSGKRFSDALKLVKDAGGNYDSTTKIWTVAVPGPETRYFVCSHCGGIGKARIQDQEYCTRLGAKGRPCGLTGRHAHSDEDCGKCEGQGRISRQVKSPAQDKLDTLESAYGVQVTAVDDGGRAALEAEREQLKARLAEIDKLLGA